MSWPATRTGGGPPAAPEGMAGGVPQGRPPQKAGVGQRFGCGILLQTSAGLPPPIRTPGPPKTVHPPPTSTPSHAHGCQLFQRSRLTTLLFGCPWGKPFAGAIKQATADSGRHRAGRRHPGGQAKRPGIVAGPGRRPTELETRPEGGAATHPGEIWPLASAGECPAGGLRGGVAESPGPDAPQLAWSGFRGIVPRCRRFSCRFKAPGKCSPNITRLRLRREPRDANKKKPATTCLEPKLHTSGRPRNALGRCHPQVLKYSRGIGWPQRSSLPSGWGPERPRGRGSSAMSARPRCGRSKASRPAWGHDTAAEYSGPDRGRSVRPPCRLRAGGR